MASGQRAPGEWRSRVCDATDLDTPAFRQMYQTLGFGEGSDHRKEWEKAFVALLVEHFGLEGDERSCLGLGVGEEVLLFHFANRCGRVVGIDKYRSARWSSATRKAEEVANRAPFPYRKERLTVRDMDLRGLAFDAETFDFVWSVWAVEHVESLVDVGAVFREVARVLKPGGFAFIATEWNWLSENPRYVPGCLIFDEPAIAHVLGGVPELRLIGPIATRQAEFAKHVYRSECLSNANEEIPLLFNRFTARTFATPVMLVLKRMKS